MKRWFIKPVLFLLVCALSGSARPKPETTPTPEAATALVVSLKSIASRYGYQKISSTEDQVTLTGLRSSLIFYKNGRKVDVDGTLVMLNRECRLVKGHWVVDVADAEKTLLPVLTPHQVLADCGHRVIVLDPGHGGTDTGAISAAGEREKVISLDLAQRTARYLRNAGYTVILTRTGDTAMRLADRAAVAERVKADLFVSIHLNAVKDNTEADGIETFVLSLPGYRSTNDPSSHTPSRLLYKGNRHDQANAALGFALQKELISSMQATDRGLRRARFLVLKEVTCPAALVECGFLSNAAEAGRLSVPYYRERIALALARGIDQHMANVKRAVVEAAILESGKQRK